jgi:predicted PurR-regulated permease PerM
MMDRSLFKTLLAYTFTLLLLYLLYSILSPFLGTLVWAGAIGIITLPLYEKLLVRCKGREITAAALLTAAVVLAVILPLVGLIFTLSREAALAYQYLENATADGSTLALGNILNHPAVIPLLERIRPLTSSLSLDLDAMLLPTVKKGIAAMLNYSTGIVKNFFAFLFKLVLMVISLFFFYKDGAHFLERFWLVVDIREGLKASIIETVSRVLGAVMYGIVLTCLVQGTLGGLGFWVAGLPSPILFGALMAVCALIPLIGTALIWLPGALYLLMHGQTMYALMLVAWGVVVVSGIDNIIRPLFISGIAKLHILLIVFGVLGGLLAFGITGLVAGPVILALVLVFFDESRQENMLQEGSDHI